MITSQDTVANYFLKNMNDNDISIVQDAPTIAVVTLQLLHILGFSNIILVGQNLAYRGRDRHAQGISYSRKVSDKEIKNGIWVKDVCGNDILTDEGYNSMRQQMELYIKLLPKTNVINTTKGGANIEGTEFKELKEVMDTILNEKIVEENWLDGNKTGYDIEHLKSQFRKMNRSYDNALKINKEYTSILNKILKAIDNRNYPQAENLYIKLDKQLRKLENNDFYKTFILPMNRVEYKVLADSIDSLNEEKNPYDKGIRIVEKFRGFMDICMKNIKAIEAIYSEIEKDIQDNIGRSE